MVSKSSMCLLVCVAFMAIVSQPQNAVQADVHIGSCVWGAVDYTSNCNEECKRRGHTGGHCGSFANVNCWCLLVCANISNAYILLSANIEDIKKVASKFLSSNVVEQISSLISKFKTNVKNNVSEENTVNENTVHKVSDDEIEERAPTYHKPHKISKETQVIDREINDKYNFESVNKDERERKKYKLSMNKEDTERDKYKASMNKDDTERDKYKASMNKDDTERDRPASMHKDETERHRYRPASMNKHETERDRHKSESINKDDIAKYRHKLASMKNQIHEMSQEDKSYKNVINEVKHDIDRDILRTTNGLRDRDINDRQEEREMKFKKGIVRDDLYWNDNEADGGVERKVATSGRVKLPNDGKHEYNWEISTEN